MTGIGQDSTYKNSDDWGFIAFCYPHYLPKMFLFDQDLKHASSSHKQRC